MISADSPEYVPIFNALLRNPFVTASPCHLPLHKGGFGWCKRGDAGETRTSGRSKPRPYVTTKYAAYYRSHQKPQKSPVIVLVTGDFLSDGLNFNQIRIAGGAVDHAAGHDDVVAGLQIQRADGCFAGVVEQHVGGLEAFIQHRQHAP